MSKGRYHGIYRPTSTPAAHLRGLIGKHCEIDGSISGDYIFVRFDEPIMIHHEPANSRWFKFRKSSFKIFDRQAAAQAPVQSSQDDDREYTPAEFQAALKKAVDAGMPIGSIATMGQVSLERATDWVNGDSFPAWEMRRGVIQFVENMMGAADGVAQAWLGHKEEA